MRFGLEEDIIEAINKVLETVQMVDQALVFGSRAKGNYRADSDIDLALKGEHLTHADLLHLAVKLDDLHLPWKFDLVNYHTIDDLAVVEHIDRVSIEMYTRWKELVFSDFVEINHSISLKKGEKYSFVEMKDLNDGQKYCEPHQRRILSGGTRFRNGDTLFARITPCLENGKICQVRGLLNDVGFGSTEFYVFSGKPTFSDNEFIYYLSRWEEVRAHAELNFDGTSGRQRVPKSAFDNLILQTPPLPEQTAIASVLSSLDDKIDLLHLQNKTLEQMAETLFRKMMSEQDLKDENDGQEDIIESTLDELVTFEPREKIDKSKDYTFFDMKSLSNDDMAISEGVQRKATSGSSFRNGDTLLAKITPCLENGKTGFVMNLGEDEIARGSTEFIVMRSKGFVSPYWVYCLARDSDFRETAILSMTGTSGRQRVQTDVLKSLDITLSRSAMAWFHANAESFFSKIKSNQIQISSLTRLRDSLLPKLMSGEVRVKLSEQD